MRHGSGLLHGPYRVRRRTQDGSGLRGASSRGPSVSRTVVDAHPVGPAVGRVSCDDGCARHSACRAQPTVFCVASIRGPSVSCAVVDGCILGAASRMVGRVGCDDGRARHSACVSRAADGPLSREHPRALCLACVLGTASPWAEPDLMLNLILNRIMM